MPAAREFDPIKRMAARRNPKITEEHRSRIQTSQLINRLTALVNGDVEMPPHAVTAALGLLRKTLPDISSVEMTGETGGPVEIVIRTMVDQNGQPALVDQDGHDIPEPPEKISINAGGVGV